MRAFITPALAAGAVVAALFAPNLLKSPTLVAQPVAPPLSPPVAPPVVTPVAAAGDGPTVAVRVDRAATTPGGTVRVELTVSAPQAADQAHDLPSDVIVVLDTSGSMAGDKLADARRSASALLDLLGPDDRVALVTFDSDASVRQGLGPVTKGSYAVLTELQASGGTGMEQGLLAASRVIAERAPGRARRVVMLSDGQPDDATRLPALAAQLAGVETPLSTVGIGVDAQPLLLQQLADQGTGNFYWVQPNTALADVFRDEFHAARSTVAQGAALDVDVGDGARLLGASGLQVSAGGAIELGSLFSAQRRTIYLDVQVSGSRSGVVELGDVALTWTSPSGEAGSRRVNLGTVTVTHDAAVADASVDGEVWAKGVLREEYNAVRSNVAKALAIGRRDQAAAELNQYRSRVTALNATVGSAAIVDNLAEAEALEQQVMDGQIQGESAAKLATDSYQSRRSGQAVGY